MNNISSLYHYTSFETFVKIWLSKKLKFGDITLLNDICEADKKISTPLVPGGIERFSWAENVVSPYKQLSFTKDFDSKTKGSMSPYMWGHYGDKRKGVCIEFDFKSFALDESMIHGSVEYVERLKIPFDIPATLNNETEIRKYTRENITQLFFTKSKDWKPENEYRIISDKADWLNFQEKSIKSVCVTNPKGQECEFLENLLPETIPVMFFGFRSDPDGYYFPTIYKAKDFREVCAINRSMKLEKKNLKEIIEGQQQELNISGFKMPVHDIESL